jgi:hypothetical protein
VWAIAHPKNCLENLGAIAYFTNKSVSDWPSVQRHAEFVGALRPRTVS